MSDQPNVLKLVRPASTPDPDLLAKAQRLVELVRGGEVTALAYVVTFCDGAVGSVYGVTPSGSLFSLLGGVDYVHRRVMHAVEDPQ